MGDCIKSQTIEIRPGITPLSAAKLTLNLSQYVFLLRLSAIPGMHNLHFKAK